MCDLLQYMNTNKKFNSALIDKCNCQILQVVNLRTTGLPQRPEKCDHIVVNIFLSLCAQKEVQVTIVLKIKQFWFAL